jgi:homoserine kinase type II
VAVYTHIGAEDMEALVTQFGAGSLISAKGIAEGVENSNYLVDTTQGRFILTVYEKRVRKGDLPFFLSLTSHLADKGCAVPRARNAVDGSATVAWRGKSIALIEFSNGLSVSNPTPHQAREVGAALGRLHSAVKDFPLNRPNDLGLSDWVELAKSCGNDLDAIAPGLKLRVEDECAFLQEHWPHQLPRCVIHADLFPDNVLMNRNEVCAIIDFYFACTEVRAWDLAIAHSAWSFSPDGRIYNGAIGRALIEGYERAHGRAPQERQAFNILARGACLRFLLTRAWDWLNTPADALVTRKDPLAFLRRLDHYAAA